METGQVSRPAAAPVKPVRKRRQRNRVKHARTLNDRVTKRGKVIVLLPRGWTTRSKLDWRVFSDPRIREQVEPDEDLVWPNEREQFSRCAQHWEGKTSHTKCARGPTPKCTADRAAVLKRLPYGAVMTAPTHMAVNLRTYPRDKELGMVLHTHKQEATRVMNKASSSKSERSSAEEVLALLGHATVRRYLAKHRINVDDPTKPAPVLPDDADFTWFDESVRAPVDPRATRTARQRAKARRDAHHPADGGASAAPSPVGRGDAATRSSSSPSTATLMFGYTQRHAPSDMLQELSQVPMPHHHVQAAQSCALSILQLAQMTGLPVSPPPPPVASAGSDA